MTPNPYPIETEAPDITPYREGNTGVEYVTTLDSGRDGRTPCSLATSAITGRVEKAVRPVPANMVME